MFKFEFGCHFSGECGIGEGKIRDWKINTEVGTAFQSRDNEDLH